MATSSSASSGAFHLPPTSSRILTPRRRTPIQMKATITHSNAMVETYREILPWRSITRPSAWACPMETASSTITSTPVCHQDANSWVLTALMRGQPPATPLELTAQNPLPVWLHLIKKGWEASAGADCMPQYQDNDVVIISGVRTAVGKFQGSLSDRSAPQLGAIVVREAVKRAQVDPAQVDECIMGNVVSAGLGQNPARQAAIFGGLPPEVSALTVNKVCGSGLKAVALGAQAIQTGNSEIVVAGGMESMTNAPYLLPQARKGYRLGNSQIIDSMIQDGLWDVYNNYHMGVTGENVAEKYKITREEQDEFALNSHRKAAAAQRECRLKSQIIPVELSAKKKGEAPVMFDKDESVREDATIEALRALKPAFKKDGTVTAGNAPGVNDGAAAVVVTSYKRAKALGAEP